MTKSRSPLMSAFIRSSAAPSEEKPEFTAVWMGTPRFTMFTARMLPFWRSEASRSGLAVSTAVLATVRLVPAASARYARLRWVPSVIGPAKSVAPFNAAAPPTYSGGNAPGPRGMLSTEPGPAIRLPATVRSGAVSSPPPADAASVAPCAVPGAGIVRVPPLRISDPSRPPAPANDAPGWTIIEPPSVPFSASVPSETVVDPLNGCAPLSVNV
jgi:hypothetical protein